MDPELVAKKLEYEAKKARLKELRMRLTCTICGAKPKTLLNCPCGTTQYCSTDCQRIDWRDRGHRKACKKIRADRAAEAARAEAPTPLPSPPREVVYGPAPRSQADEIRARIAAEHEAARARREANPEPEPTSARWGTRCPICLEEWDVNAKDVFRVCCCGRVCESCEDKIGFDACPLCRLPCAETDAEQLARLRRHVENEVPEAIVHLGRMYDQGDSFCGIVQNPKKAVKLWKRAVELGDAEAMNHLGAAYESGRGVKHADVKKATQLYRMGVDRGSVRAVINLATVLFQGLQLQLQETSRELLEKQGEAQVEIDSTLASEIFRLYDLAATKGHHGGVYMKGLCYKAGLGVEKDYVEARRWLERAASKGQEHCQRAIDQLAKLDAEEATSSKPP